MAKITAIEVQKRNQNRVSIYLNDQFFKGISLYTCKKMKLVIGMEIDEETLLNVMIEEEFEEGKNYVTKYCTDNPEKAIRDKLKKKEYHPKNIERLIEFMKNYNLINDERYALAYANDKSKFSKHGKKKIEQVLKIKGIRADIIEKAIGRIEDDDQLDAAIRKLNTKINDYKRKSSNPYELKSKCYGFLMRGGFDSVVIKKAITFVLDDFNE